MKMSRFVSLICLCCCLFGVVKSAVACDLDADGIDDRLTYELSDKVLTWRWITATNPEVQTLSIAASAKTLPAPADYYGAGQATALGHIELDNVLWKAYRPGEDTDLIGFALPNLSYYPSLDVNGDGISDMIKLFNRCGTFSKRCKRRNVEIFFVINGVVDDTTFRISATATRFYGKALNPLLGIDVDGDGDKDFCFAAPSRKNPKVFQMTCSDILAQTQLVKFKLGKLFQAPLALERSAGQPDAVLLVRKLKKKGETQLTIYDIQTGTSTRATIAASGKLLVGDWLGRGYQQIAVATAGQLNVYDPVTQATSSLSRPAGNAIDCTNNLSGAKESRIQTSKNVCKLSRCGK